MAKETSLIKFSSNGKEHTLWRDVSINLSMVNACPSFYLMANDIYLGKPDDWKLKMGKECSLSLMEKDLLKKSYIEEIYPTSSSTGGSTMEIMGRDKTCDLFDCSYEDTNKEWKKQSVGSIIKNLCKHYDIEVSISSNVQSQCDTKIPTFKPIDGASVFDSIQRLCLPMGLLPLCKGDGKLTITRAETTTQLKDTIERGRNVTNSKILLSDRARYSKYIIRSQDNGEDSKSIKDWTQCKGDFSDTVVKRKREFSSFLDIPGDSNKCRNYARWIAWNRGALSRLFVYSVSGWSMSDGELWGVNKLVSIKDKWFNIQESMLIIDIDFYLVNRTSARTDITVCNKNIFSFSNTAVNAKMKAFDD